MILGVLLVGQPTSFAKNTACGSPAFKWLKFRRSEQYGGKIWYDASMDPWT